MPGQRRWPRWRRSCGGTIGSCISSLIGTRCTGRGRSYQRRWCASIRVRGLCGRCFGLATAQPSGRNLSFLSGRIPSLHTGAFKALIQDLGVIKPKSTALNLSAFEQCFLQVTAASAPSYGADEVAPAPTLNRMELLQCLVRIADMTYFRTEKTAASLAHAVELLLTENVSRVVRKDFAFVERPHVYSNVFRRMCCYTRDCSETICENLQTIKGLFSKYCLSEKDGADAELRGSMSFEEYASKALNSQTPQEPPRRPHHALTTATRAVQYAHLVIAAALSTVVPALPHCSGTRSSSLTLSFVTTSSRLESRRSHGCGRGCGSSTTASPSGARCAVTTASYAVASPALSASFYSPSCKSVHLSHPPPPPAFCVP